MLIGEKIADFKINGIDENGNENLFSGADFFNKGKNVVIYFYPKDNTPGCTTEACDFRDNINRLTSKVIVVGASAESIASHLKFKEKHALNFALLSDTDKVLLQELGAWGEKMNYGKKYMGIIRSTFVFDEKGILIKEWRNVKVKGHVDEVLSFLSDK